MRVTNNDNSDRSYFVYNWEDTSQTFGLASGRINAGGKWDWTPPDNGSGFYTVLIHRDPSGSTLSPGGCVVPGKLTVTGAATFQAGSTYKPVLNGATAGTQYDQLASGGTVTINSNVTLTPILGFAPPLNQQFTSSRRPRSAGPSPTPRTARPSASPSAASATS